MLTESIRTTTSRGKVHEVHDGKILVGSGETSEQAWEDAARDVAERLVQLQESMREALKRS